MFLSLFTIAFSASTVFASTWPSPPEQTTIKLSPSEISASRASAPTLSPTSNVEGKAFDRIIQIWLENTDYDTAARNSDMKWLATQGILLTNFWALTHPSQPNYLAAVGGDTHGLDTDDFYAVPANISTIVDALDTKGISWGSYMEGMPFAGFQGDRYVNQENGRNNYVRKHNPLILYDSVTSNATRLSLVKNFTSLDQDIQRNFIPQWSFITPNMTSDGHDTGLPHAASWTRNFLTPLLENKSFNANHTLILLTFDENEKYPTQNHVFTLLLGSAIPSALYGTHDATFYTHYSVLSTVEANWGLPSLGRWDCGANIFQLVANLTSPRYVNWDVETKNLYFNSTYPGPLSKHRYQAEWPRPETKEACAAGYGVLEQVKRAWGEGEGGRKYTWPYPVDEASGNNVGGSATRAGQSVTVASTPSPTSIQFLVSRAVYDAIMSWR
ncbi:phosphoesterase family-domain-containing protein [Clohesyomyces aquaticus]|uniref:Phosphoesterase family-domain-containing protein n=1 Tax=Clohesyomyces aquaticus TaxID=1231657 RepID=A0A1Y1YSF1_9PLEO|nr:phosphoesterase family-domain-containing protein [Clohesyomyces aquaticus]